MKKKKKTGKRARAARARGTIFFPPRHARLAGAVSIASVKEAVETVSRVKRLRGFSLKQKRAALNLAAGRAKALASRRGLSLKEKTELERVRRALLKGSRSLAGKKR